MQRNRTRLTVEERFWTKIDRADGCWPWTGPADPFGYGKFWDGARNWRAHRFAYELLVGPIPDGLVIDHLCRNPGCVNPAHLEPVTNRENTLRGIGISAQNAVKTHCVNGHEFTPENTYYAPSRPNRRACRACLLLNSRRRKRRLSAQAAAEAGAGIDYPHSPD